MSQGPGRQASAARVPRREAAAPEPPGSDWQAEGKTYPGARQEPPDGWDTVPRAHGSLGTPVLTPAAALEWRSLASGPKEHYLHTAVLPLDRAQKQASQEPPVLEQLQRAPEHR